MNLMNVFMKFFISEVNRTKMVFHYKGTDHIDMIGLFCFA